MAALAIFQPDARAAARLTEALAGAHRIVRRRSWTALDRMLSDGELEGCLVDAEHPTREEATRHIAHLRAHHPGVAIIAYVESDRRAALYDLGGLGVDGIVRSSEPHGTRLRTTVDQAFARARGVRIRHRLEDRFGEVGAAAVGWAVAHATDEPGVEQMAVGLGRTDRALRDALHDVALPPPYRLLLWGRLLLAGAKLHQDRSSPEEVAFSLGYDTTTSLARAMKRHTGYTLRQISEAGGMEQVLEALLATASRGTARGSGRATTAGLAAALALAGCTGLGVGGGGVDRGAIRDILESPGIEQMHVGVLAVDARSGRTLYARDEHKKFVPASNQKILVTAAAMTMLGPDHRFRTEAWAVGPRSGPFLDGDLVVVGSGDPTLSGRFWDSGTAALRALADSVGASGIERVGGALIVDASAWDSASIAPTWEVEDLRYAYGSTGGAFAIDEGEIRVVVEAGPAAGSPARVDWSPFGTSDYLRSRVKTAPPDSSTRVTPHYLPETRQLVLDGVVEPGTVDTLAFALRDPVRQASAALARALEDRGIALEAGWDVRWSVGEALGHGCVAGALEACPAARLVAALESPPLSRIVEGILEPSQNWMTEQLIRALAAAFGAEGSWSEGTDLVEAFLIEHVGVDTLDVSARDGSGLSAYNLVTPRALVRVLDHMRRGPFADAYRAALAEPGEEDSSLERRLAGLEGRVFAKTGTISNVNSLSGYLVRENGREVIFSILTNGSGLPSSYVRAAIDDIVRVLAR